jgi:hypothetical protein
MDSEVHFGAAMKLTAWDNNEVLDAFIIKWKYTTGTASGSHLSQKEVAGKLLAI